MKNNVSGNRQKAVNFERGGSVLAGQRVDNDLLVGAPDGSRHLLTHFVRGTSRLGEVLPVDLVHVLPHDDYKVNLNHTCQFKPMPKPTFDNIITKMHSFGIRYVDIFGDYFPLFKTGGKLATSKRELPYFDLRDKVYDNDSHNMTAQYLLSIALIAWSFSHKCRFQDSYEFIRTKNEQSQYVWDVEHLALVFDSAFGKGSLLDMFNAGVGHIDRDALEGKSIIPQTIDVDVPSMIPLAPLVAYQRICNDYFRIEDYSYDMFYEYENTFDKLHRITLPSDQRIDIDDIFDYTNFDIQLPYGTIIRHLDKIYIPDDNAVRDIIVSKDEMHFKLGFQSYSYVKNGAEVELTADLNLNYRGSTQPNRTVVSFSPSMVMLGWLLSKSSVPMEKDYPTMILPRTQRGVVESIGSNDSMRSFVTTDAGLTAAYIHNHNNNTNGYYKFQTSSNGTLQYVAADNYATDEKSMYVDVVSSSLDMNTLRWINAVTKLAEKENLVGPDYAKQLLVEFGVEPEWALVDRIQYLGGLLCQPRVDKVTSQSDTYKADGMVLGDFAGDASQFGQGSFTYHSDDFGMIITVMSTIPQASYSRFIDRNLYKVFDFTTWFNKAFEDLTEQHLYSEEFSGNDTFRLANLVAGAELDLRDSVLGYVPRMQEYRQMLNTVHGEMIPSLGASDEIVWTAARDFNDVNKLTEKDLLYSSVDSPENSRLFMFNIVDFPPMDFTASFGISVVRKVGKITLPITI